MTFLIALFLGIIAIFCVRQMVNQKALSERQVKNELQERDRLITLLRYQLNRWVNEPAFLAPWSVTSDTIRRDMTTLGVTTFESFILAAKPEWWFERAHEWVMANSKANRQLARQILRATHTAYLKDALADKLGDDQFLRVERRLREYYQYVDAKLPEFKPNGQMDKWWQDIDWWRDEYEVEAKILGILSAWNFHSDDEECGGNRHAPRYRWIKAQVQERGTQEYDVICEEARSRFPETWRL